MTAVCCLNVFAFDLLQNLLILQLWHVHNDLTLSLDISLGFYPGSPIYLKGVTRVCL